MILNGALRLSPAAAALAGALHAQFRDCWTKLPEGAISALGEYRAAPVPDDLRERRVELIVEASDLTMLRRALDSDADAVAVDFDDTFSPTLANVQAAYDALAWVAQSSKPLLARTRALYAVEMTWEFDGKPGIAALCDLSAVLTARPEHPFHLYLPKLETQAEARLWHDVLTFAERHLGLPPDTVRCCLQIETFQGLLNADALLGELATRTYGLNAGRWDYVFSLTKHLGKTRTEAMPPRSQLTMDEPAMHAYAQHLVNVCQQRGAEAIGGTAAIAPDPVNPRPALNTVKADKRREAAQGFTAAWAGLPELLDAVREGFNTSPITAMGDASPSIPLPLWEREGGPQGRKGEGATVPTFLALPSPSSLPLAELRDSISLALDVFSAWFEGRGVISRNGRVEDTATAELARALLWQWVRVGVRLDDGSSLTSERYLSERRKLMPDEAKASRLLDHLVLSDSCAAYFPREAQLLFGGLS